MPPRAHSPARTPIGNRHVNLLRTLRRITCRQTSSNGANIPGFRSSLRKLDAILAGKSSARLQLFKQRKLFSGRSLPVRLSANF